MSDLIQTGSLTERGMLISLVISRWTARKTDRQASDEVTRAHGADRDSGQFNKWLVPKSVLRDIDGIAARLRLFHYEQTLPWSDLGYRILPAQNYFAYLGRYNELRDEFEAAVRVFVASYADYVTQARTSLGTLFQAGDYPAISEIGDKFQLSFSVMALPTGADFRVDLGDEIRDRLAAEIEARTAAAIAAATKDIWQRLYDAVEDLRDRLKRFSVTPEGKVEHTFRDTAIVNLQELVTLLPRLNMTSDPGLEAMGRRLAASLCAEDPETLRRDDRRRRDVTAEADAILNAMSGYVS
jgi:hypothetical protein